MVVVRRWIPLFGLFAAIVSSRAAADDTVREEDAAEANDPAVDDVIEIDLGEIGGESSDPSPPPESDEAALSVGMEDVVISGTRTPTELSNLSVPVSVVKRQRIEARGARDAGDAVENLSGVFVNNYEAAGRGGPGTSLVIHGLPSDRVLVLVDGQRMPWSMRAMDLELVPAAIIRNIEIVKGPSSSLYGSDAVGGVAHILTREPSEDLELEAELWGGSHRTLGMNAFHAWSMGSVGWVVNFNREQSRGWMDDKNQQLVVDLSEGGVSDDSVLVPWKRQNPYATEDLFAKVVWEPDDSVELFVSSRFHIEDNEKEDTDRYRYDDHKRRLAVQAGTRYRSDRWNVSLQANFFRRDQKTRSRTVSHLVNPTPPPPRIATAARQGNDTVGNDFSVELVSTYMAADWSLLTVGAEYRHERLAYDAFERSDLLDEMEGYEAWQTTVGSFVQNETFLFEDVWTVVPGVRVDYHPDWGTQVNPKISTLVNVTDSTAVRAGAGRAFRAPIISQLYRPVFRHVGYYIVGNPALKPETAYAWNAEVEQKLDERWKITAGYFQYELFDMLATVVPNDLLLGGMSVMTYDNLKRARIVGGEAQIRMGITSRLDASIDYTYTKTQVVALESGFDIGDMEARNHLGTVPEHNAGAQVMYDDPSLGLGGFIGASYQSARDFVGMGGRWYRADHRVGTRARVYKEIGQHTEVSLRATNWLFYQWDREGDGDTDMPPLSVYGHVSVKL